MYLCCLGDYRHVKLVSFSPELVNLSCLPAVAFRSLSRK